MSEFLLGLLAGVLLMFGWGYAIHRSERREKESRRESVRAQRDRDERRYRDQIARGIFDA